MALAAIAAKRNLLTAANKEAPVGGLPGLPCAENLMLVLRPSENYVGSPSPRVPEGGL